MLPQLQICRIGDRELGTEHSIAEFLGIPNRQQFPDNFLLRILLVYMCLVEQKSQGLLPGALVLILTSFVRRLGDDCVVTY